MAHAASRLVPVAALALALMAFWAVDALGQRAWVAPASERVRQNPLAPDEKTLELGRKIAETNCMPCHGSHFRGDGPAAATLNPRPADWTSPRVQEQTDGELFWKISAGRSAMPSWKQLPERDRWAIIRFIKSLKPL